jgi:hypothetical protein
MCVTKKENMFEAKQPQTTHPVASTLANLRKLGNQSILLKKEICLLTNLGF